MKNKFLKSGALFLGTVVACTQLATAQTTAVTETTTSSTNAAGTITSFTPGQSIVMSSETSTTPVTYR